MRIDVWLAAIAFTALTLPAQEPDHPALQKITKAAAGLGIKENEVSKALFEGRLKISFEELEEATNALGKSAAECSFNWNRRFGRIKDFAEVSTVLNGKAVKLTGDDLLLRLLMRTNRFTESLAFRAMPRVRWQASWRNSARTRPWRVSAFV